MTDFKQQVTDYLNSNQPICEDLMCEGGYITNWESNELPFEYKGVDFYGGEGQG